MINIYQTSEWKENILVSPIWTIWISRHLEKFPIPMTDPWDERYIYPIKNPHKNQPTNVGKYTVRLGLFHPTYWSYFSPIVTGRGPASHGNPSFLIQLQELHQTFTEVSRDAERAPLEASSHGKGRVPRFFFCQNDMTWILLSQVNRVGWL